MEQVIAAVKHRQELQSQLRSIDREITRALIDKELLEFFKVDWNKLNRVANNVLHD